MKLRATVTKASRDDCDTYLLTVRGQLILPVDGISDYFRPGDVRPGTFRIDVPCTAENMKAFHVGAEFEFDLSIDE